MDGWMDVDYCSEAPSLAVRRNFKCIYLFIGATNYHIWAKTSGAGEDIPFGHTLLHHLFYSKLDYNSLNEL